ncbi:MAG: SpoIIE family protein phosphatase [Chloroflexota bacterium]|nr:SpoIIE family protein phosphatase [Chloroflexota bacterium]
MRLTKDKMVATLRNVSIFSALPQEALEEMAALAEVVSVHAGQAILSEGESSRDLFIIVEGRVQLGKLGRSMRELGPNQFFGETAILQRSARTASVTASEDSVMLRLDEGPFLDLIQRRGETMLGLITEYNARLLKYMNDLNTLHHQLEHVILPLGVTLATEEDPSVLVEKILVEAMRLCNAECGTIYLRVEDDYLRHVAIRNRPRSRALGGTTGKPIPYAPLNLADPRNARNIAVYVAQQGTTVNVTDVYAVEEYDFSEVKAHDVELSYRSKSCLTVALKDPTGIAIGVLQLINAQDPVSETIVSFDAFQQLVIESLMSQAAVALNTQTLLHRQKEFVKLEQDIHVARRIQAGFLPRSLPVLDGWEIAASFQPAREVAGDFYDAFMMTQNRRIGFVIADVVDKGVPAALFMALVRSLTRAFAQQNYSVDWTSMLGEDTRRRATRTRALPSAGTMSLLNAVLLTNNYIVDNHADDNMFATLFFGMLDPVSGQLAYINAGHNPPLILDANGRVKQSLTNTGAAVGMFRDIDYKIEQAVLEPGDLLFTYTDGVTEARDPSGAFLTEKGLLELLDRPWDSAATLLNTIQEHLRVFMSGAVQADDITMLGVRRVTG